MSIVLIFDCGATNLRTIAINQQGEILASYHLANQTQVGLESPDYHIWDFAEIWQKLDYCAEQTLAQLKQQQIELNHVVAIGITTFGVDGAPFNAQGQQLYPIISWKCPRTSAIMQNLADYVDVTEHYHRNGIGQYSFNTLFKLLWLKQQQPEIYAQMDKWVFISAMISHRLTGVLVTDRTMAGTSMMTDLATGDWNQQILQLLDLTPNHFPPMKNAGEKIAPLSTALCQKYGLNPIPVICCGHDTQFAVFGSGAGINQPVLSSGTWEILMVRTRQAHPDISFIKQGLTTELDAQPQVFNPAVQWVGSGIMEWIGKTFFNDVYNTQDYYSTMIKEGTEAGKSAVHFAGDFSQLGEGQLTGLSMYANRGQIYYAALQYMTNQLKQGLQILEQVGEFKANSLICVGGGCKNALWNQLRANRLNLPIDVVDVAEATVLGAAMFAFTAVGVYANVELAQTQMQPNKQRIYPQN